MKKHKECSDCTHEVGRRTGFFPRPPKFGKPASSEGYDKSDDRCPWINCWDDGSGIYDQCTYERYHMRGHSFQHTPPNGEW